MRLERLRQLMDEQKLAGLLVTQPHNRRYLSGFSGSNGVLVISAERQIVATDSRYYTQVREQCPDWELAEVGYDFAGNMLDLLREVGLAGTRIGVNPAVLMVEALHQWERGVKGHVQFVQVTGLVEQIRMIKDAQELTAIRKAVALADQAYAHIVQFIEPGMTELGVAWELEQFMRVNGAEALAFASMTASGPNSAKPHADPSTRVIQAGEPLLLDFGCVVDGYCSDISRSFCVGEPNDPDYLTAWQHVREAEEAAIAGAKAGMTGVEVDKLAREPLEEQYGTDHAFQHSLGHSLGLYVHESPRFSFRYDKEIPAGAVMTVEPGLYIPNRWGIRIEDIVLVTESGTEVLTAAPKDAVV